MNEENERRNEGSSKGPPFHFRTLAVFITSLRSLLFSFFASFFFVWKTVEKKEIKQNGVKKGESLC
jgi:hypothetical protein